MPSTGWISKTPRSCPNREWFATKHDQTWLSDQTCWCCIERPNGIEHVWMNKSFTMLWRRSHFIKHNPTRCPKRKCLVTKQCLILFDRRSQTLLECLMPSSVEFISQKTSKKFQEDTWKKLRMANKGEDGKGFV